jgi:hypothetical protein
MTNQLLYQKMEELSRTIGLPTANAFELEEDLKTLNQFNATEYIWLLRANGTLLFPLRHGVNPEYLHYWLHANHGQNILLFLVTASSGQIEKISRDTAERLIFSPPANLDNCVDLNTLVVTVNKTIHHCRLVGAWAHSCLSMQLSEWPEWLQYFKIAKNLVMAAFLEKAISKGMMLSERRSA